MTDGYRPLLKITITPLVRQALIASGRIKWTQRNDAFAISQAVTKLLKDIESGVEPTSDDLRSRVRQTLRQL